MGDEAKIIHGENCECCENLSPLSKAVLSDIQEMMTGLKGSGVMSTSPKQKVIDNLKTINQELSTAGGIEDVIAIAEAFYSINFDNINTSDLGYDKSDLLDLSYADIAAVEPKLVPDSLKNSKDKISEDFAAKVPTTKISKLAKEKDLGGVKAKDLFDNPEFNFGKIFKLNIPGVDLSKIKNPKFSFFPPSFTIEKSITLGIATVGIKIFISLPEVSWFPIISPNFDTAAKALDKLKGAKNKQQVTPALGKSLEDLKKIAKESLGNKKLKNGSSDASATANNNQSSAAAKNANAKNANAKDTAKDTPTEDTANDINSQILKDLTNAKNPDDFFTILDENSIVLTEEIDLGEQMAKMVNDANKAADLLKKYGKSGTFEADSLATSDIGLCAEAEPPTPVFTEEEVEKCIPCEEAKKKKELEDNAKLNLDFNFQKELDDIEKTVNDLVSDDVQKKLIDAVKDMISNMQKESDISKECSNKKVTEFNKTYFLLEAEALHYYTHSYISELAGANAKYDETFKPYYLERDRLEKINAGIQAEIDLLKTSLPKPPTSTNTNTGNTTGTGNVVSQINSATNPPQKSASQLLIETKEQEIANNLLLIAKQKNKFEDEVEKFKDAILGDLGKLNTSGVFSSVSDKIKALRTKVFGAEMNPISNLVGFDEKGMLQMFVNKEILLLLKKFELEAKEKGNSFMFFNYFRLINHVFVQIPDADPPPLLRRGLIETTLWKKYYSSSRIDYLFTWKEQGYNMPKPMYDDEGNLIGKTQNITIKNGEGEEVTIEDVPENLDKIEIDETIAIPFWEKIDVNTKVRVLELINNVKSSKTSTDYLNKIKAAARIEAKLYYEDFISSFNFTEKTTSLVFTPPQDIAAQYNISLSIYDAIKNELAKSDKIVEECKECEEKQKKRMSLAAKKAAKKMEKNGLIDSSVLIDAVGNLAEGKKPKPKSTALLEKNCRDKLGTDPVGAIPPTGECPGPDKFCYWVEFTKCLQKVSLMPIPELDPQNLALRLFRYYPVALRIPIAPFAFPTLAMGIPDVTISIPLPHLWIPIIAMQTPLGTFVVWIAMAGGMIPDPFVMLIDERMQSSFIITLKGPTPIPARQLLMVNPLEQKSLLDLFPNFETKLKLDLGGFPGKLLMGSTRGDHNDPDSAKTVIDKIKNLIKKSLDDLEIEDPWFSKDNDEDPRVKSVKERIQKFEELDLDFSDPKELFDELFSDLLKIATKAIDKIKIPAIKIPKNSKGMMFELPAVLEMIADLNKLIDTASNGPALLMEKIMKNLGTSVKVLNVKKILDQEARAYLANPDTVAQLYEWDLEIEELEAGLADLKTDLSLEDLEKATTERTKKIKSFLIKYIKKVADLITPELLGFAALIDNIPGLPFPCYESVTLPPIPPEWIAIIGAIKAAPNILNAIPDNVFSGLIKGVINLGKSLPRSEQIITAVLGIILDQIPDLILPTANFKNLLKSIKKALKDFILLFKVRLPKPGLPTQLVIPGSVVKAIIKAALGPALDAVKAMFMQQVQKILDKVGPERIAAIIAFIAIIKLLFGTDLKKIKGRDIKAFIVKIVEDVAYPPLDGVKPMIDAANAIKAGFISIMDLFTLPDPFKFPPLKKEGPFLELKTELIKDFVDPLLLTVVPLIFRAVPWPVVLLGASSTPARFFLTKIHPTKPIDKLPTWESLSMQNIPFVLFLDQIAATAQRATLLGSNYVAPPYFIPLTP